VVIFDKYTKGNDSEILNEFLIYYKSIDPDIIVTYNGNDFDLPYILQRMQKYKIDINQLGRYVRCVMRKVRKTLNLMAEFILIA